MENIKSMSSKALAYVVLLYKKLKINKDLAILAMQELEYRNDQGDSFDYNSYIESEYNKMEQKPSSINEIKQKIGAAPKIINNEIPSIIDMVNNLKI
jgi:hypothetical protein